MFRFARRAARLLDGVADHRHDGVIGEPALARAVVVKNVTKPKLALLHQELPKEPRWKGGEYRKGEP
jgi:hypothetical protein